MAAVVEVVWRQALEIVQWILGLTIFDDFEMEMGPGTVASGADSTDPLSDFDLLPDFDVDAGKMGVAGS